MTQVMEPTNQYLSDFERLEKQPAVPALQRLRKAAIARFAELGFPGPRDEEWRFTPLAPLIQTPFRLPSVGAMDGMKDQCIGLDDEFGVTLACVNAESPFLLEGGRPCRMA